jgi:hypothetical protein
MNINQIFIILLLGIPLTIFSIEVNKDFEIPYDYEVSPFLVADNICIWDTGSYCLKIYNDAKTFRTIRFRKGEGPGEFLVVQKIYSQGKYGYIWDRLLFRMSVFTGDWKLDRVIRFPSLRRTTGFLGMVDNQYFFRWGTADHSPGRVQLTEHVGIVDEKQMKALIDIPAGELRKQEYLNYDRPIPIVVLSGNFIYYGTNREYRIDKTRIAGSKIEHIQTIQRQVRPIKLTDDLKQLKYEVLSQSNQSPKPKEKYPSFVPPLVDIAADGELLVVVTNEKIHLRKAKVDVFKNGIYIGSIELPLILSQYFIFPFSWPHYFPTGTYLQGNRLYTYHYDERDERYKIIRHTLIFEHSALRANPSARGAYYAAQAR